MNKRRRTVHLLLVEDDEVDRRAVRRALQKQRISNPLTIARDGVEALEILRGTDERPPLPRPHLILLDLNLPRMDGHQFLAELRADPALTDTIVFVLTTSRAEDDLHDAYRQHVAGYLVKGKVGEDFRRMMDVLEPYWLIVEFPPDGGEEPQP